MTVKKYQDLIAWQKAIVLVTEIYEASSSFQRGEVYGLTSQLRRAAVSVPSNIAEGQGGATSSEFVQFCVTLEDRCTSLKRKSWLPTT